MNRQEFKKLYSRYRRMRYQYNELTKPTTYFDSYSDLIFDSFERQSRSWLNANPIIKRIVEINTTKNKRN